MNALTSSLPIQQMVNGMLPIIESLMGDNGGGAQVKRLHEALVANGVMDSDSFSTSCLLHALNKAFEQAVKQ